MQDYQFERVRVEIENQVATLFMHWPDGLKVKPHLFHDELSEALHRFRNDDDIRVVILRGPGTKYFLSAQAGREDVSDEESIAQLGNPEASFASPDNYLRAMNESAATLESILLMPKPVIAMVNGDAIGIGATIAMASDIIIADEDKYITDCHIAHHYWRKNAAVNSGVVPGDGGAVFWPLDMSVHLAKEFLFTGRPVKARELADLHIINHAVPGERLQEKVDEMVKLLLDRPAWALGWTKVAMNKRVMQNLQLTLDASLAFELLSMRVRIDGSTEKGITRL